MNRTLAHFLFCLVAGFYSAALTLLLLGLWNHRWPLLPKIPEEIMPKLLLRICLTSAAIAFALSWLAP